MPEFRPLLTAREGDWALYQALHGRAIRYEVVETGTRTKTRVTLYAEGKPLGQPAVREDPADTDHLALQAARFDAVRTAVRCTVTAAGREWSATRYEDRWMDEDEVHYVRRTWVSPEAPVFGIIRMELHGSLEPGPSEATLEALLELEAYGNARSSD